MMTSFFAELKRRNVVRIAIAYVVVSWAILQFVDIIQEILTFPGWFPQMVLVLLIIGFPIALIFSWAYEVTPEGVKKTEEVDQSKSIAHGTGQKINKLIVGALVLAIAFIVYDKTVAPTDDGEATIREASIAVLPFTDLSPAGDQEYFGDGIAEEILNVLAKIPDMKVAGRTSSFKFKGQNENLQQIAEQLNVDHVLEGSIRKDGNKIRITVQLIAADDGFHLWSETYDRNLVDIFAIQDEISQAVAQAMQVQLGTEKEGSSPQSIASAEAYSLYLQGLQFLHLRGGDNLEKAAKFFEVVVILDPAFDPAWSALARTYSLLPVYAVETGQGAQEKYNKGKVAAKQAIALNPQNAQAYSALNYINLSQFEWAEAEKNNLMAITLNPNDAEIANFAGDYYRFIGDFNNGLKWETKAFELDPLHVVNSWDLAFVHYEFGKSAEGLPYAENALKVDPNYSFVFRILSYILADLGRFEDSRDAIMKAIQNNQDKAIQNNWDPFGVLDMKTFLALKEGNHEEARKYLKEMEAMVATGIGAPGRIFPYYLEMGDLEEGLKWFEKAYAVKDTALILIADFLPENYTDNPEILARFEVPGMKELYEIRRANLARNAEGGE